MLRSLRLLREPGSGFSESGPRRSPLPGPRPSSFRISESGQEERQGLQSPERGGPQPRQAIPKKPQPPDGKAADPEPGSQENGQLQSGPVLQVLAGAAEGLERGDGETREEGGEISERAESGGLRQRLQVRSVLCIR